MSKTFNDSVRLREILEHSPDGMFTIGTDLRIQYVNPAFCKLIEYTEDEILGSPITDYLGDLSILESCMHSVEETGHCNDQETIFKRKDGSVVHISKNVQALYGPNGNIHSILVSIRDMSALHHLNKALLESKTDTLTRLPSRLQLLHDLSCNRDPLTLMLLNIDSFKEINTFYGHAIGDQLLIDFANELLRNAKAMPHSVLYKLPADEYAILVRNECSADDIHGCVSTLLGALNKKHFLVSSHEINLNITVGIARTDGKEKYRNEVLHHADMALEKAKKNRKNFLFFDEAFHIKQDYANNLHWIKRLRDAIEENRIVPYYQSIVNTQTLEIEKYESLVRIIEADGSVIPPAQFLEISKKVKLYNQIMKLMITQVLDTLSLYPNRLFSINLSIDDINDDEMHTFIVDAVKNCPQSDHLIFEFLESEGIDNYDTVRRFIREMKQYGVKIAIDDFGAGYSNFIYITQLDIDYIKIDGSIIRDITTNKASQIITNTIIDFASQLDIKTVAEFVSTQEICDYLRNLPVTCLQGYYFSEPLPKPL